MLSQLRKKDVQATVSERKNSDRKPLFLVRAAGLSSYAQASQIARHGDHATRTADAFIGQNRPSATRPRPGSSAGLNPRAPTR
jgi:hypothetical protein